MFNAGKTGVSKKKMDCKEKNKNHSDDDNLNTAATHCIAVL